MNGILLFFMHRKRKFLSDDCPLEFGKIVSTSNTYNGEPTVTISCSHPVLWSMKTPNLTGGLSKN